MVYMMAQSVAGVSGQWSNRCTYHHHHHHYHLFAEHGQYE